MITWMRRNLFRSVTDALLTVVSATILGAVLIQVFQFVFLNGRWEIIQVNLKILLVGRFPEELMYLVGLSILAICFSIASLAGGVEQSSSNSQTLPAKLWGSFQRFGLLAATAALLIVLAADFDAVAFGGYVLVSIVAGTLSGRLRRTTALKKLPGLIWVFLNASIPMALIFITIGQAALEEWGGFPLTSTSRLSASL